MGQVLQHPFFSSAEALSARCAPRLMLSDKNHAFISHYQGNGGPRAMTIKYAVEAAVPGGRVWLDQDEHDKTEAGMVAGVTGSRVFVLLLTRGVLSRPWVRMEVRKALELRKPIVLVKESDERHGGVRDGPTERDQYARGAESSGDAPIEEEAAVLCERVFSEAAVVIPWHSEMEFRQAQGPPLPSRCPPRCHPTLLGLVVTTSAILRPAGR